MIEDGLFVLRFYYCIIKILIIYTFCIFHAFLKNTDYPFAPCGILQNTKSECLYSNEPASVHRHMIKDGVPTCQNISEMHQSHKSNAISLPSA